MGKKHWYYVGYATQTDGTTDFTACEVWVSQAIESSEGIEALRQALTDKAQGDVVVLGFSPMRVEEIPDQVKAGP